MSPGSSTSGLISESAQSRSSALSWTRYTLFCAPAPSTRTKAYRSGSDGIGSDTRASCVESEVSDDVPSAVDTCRLPLRPNSSRLRRYCKLSFRHVHDIQYGRTRLRAGRLYEAIELQYDSLWGEVRDHSIMSAIEP